MLAVVMHEGVALAGAGVIVGAILAELLAPLLQNQLFGVTPHEFVSYAVGVAILGGAAVLACWIPARRATAANPFDALRAE